MRHTEKKITNNDDIHITTFLPAIFGSVMP